MRSRAAAAVLLLGDLQYESGELQDFQTSYEPTWGEFKATSYPVPGNHEYRTPGASGYYTYFGERAPNPRGWYAVDLGSWRAYLLNTNCNQVDCDAQIRWLRRDIAAHPRQCSLAAMHHPMFSSGEHGDSEFAARFWPLLDNKQVDVALAGHDHDYERFAPMHAKGAVAPAQGVRSFVSGTGGKSLYSIDAPRHGSRFRHDSSMGVLFLGLGDGTYSWRYRNVEDTVLDQGTANCVS